MTPEEIAKAQGHGLFRFYKGLNLPVAFHLNMVQMELIHHHPGVTVAHDNPEINQWLIDNDMTCGVEKAMVADIHRFYMKQRSAMAGDRQWYEARRQMLSDPDVPSEVILRFASDAHLLLFRFRWL